MNLLTIMTNNSNVEINPNSEMVKALSNLCY